MIRIAITLLLILLASPAWGAELFVCNVSDGDGIQGRMEKGDILAVYPDGYFDKLVIGNKRFVVVKIPGVKVDDIKPYLTPLKDGEANLKERRWRLNMDGMSASDLTTTKKTTVQNYEMVDKTITP